VRRARDRHLRARRGPGGGAQRRAGGDPPPAQPARILCTRSPLLWCHLADASQMRCYICFMHAGSRPAEVQFSAASRCPINKARAAVFAGRCRPKDWTARPTVRFAQLLLGCPQRGLYRVHQLAMEGEEPVPGGGGGGAHGNLTRLLVCHSQAGCIIGKCGPCLATSIGDLPAVSSASALCVGYSRGA